MGAGSMLLGLFTFAYLGIHDANAAAWTSAARRRGYTSLILGALFGLAAWLFISVMAVHEPSLPYGIGCAVAGAVAAFSRSSLPSGT